ncbi:MAG: YfhO family protein [Clostridia bacterium]|nr:YfhO family protein [Clostridia bacterium]
MRFFKKYIPVLCPIAVIIIYAILFSTNDIYPFGEKTISWGDMDQQTIPLLCCFKDVLAGKSSFWLSLQNAGGINFFGVYFFYLSSPFTYLVVFFTKEMMPCAVNVMVVLKLATASATMAIYLKNAVKQANPFVVLSLCVLYAFSGWAMMYYQILSWLDTLYLFPLVLLGLLKMREGKKPLLYIISLFACMLCHFYLGYAIVVFLCLYAGVYYIFDRKESKVFLKHFIISSFISAMLSMVVLIPCFLQYLSSMRTGNIFESLQNKGFLPPIQTSLPSFYCLIILTPFIIKNSKKYNIDSQTTLFLLMLIPAFIEPIATAWQTFSYMCFPTRYSFITVALGLTLALRGITNLTQECDNQSLLSIKTNNQRVKLFLSIFALAFCVAFASFSYRFYVANKEIITAYSKTLWGNNASFKYLSIYYLIPLVFISLFYIASHYKLVQKVAVYGVIGILCITEAFFSANVYMTKPANDYAEFKSALQTQNMITDEGFYRVKSQSKHYDVNLVGAMGYNTLSHFTSLNSYSYIMLAKELGYSSYWLEVHSNGGNIFTDALLHNKYSIYRGTSTTAVYKNENYYAKESEFLFPLAFLMNTQGENTSDQSLERWQIQNNLFKRLTGLDGLYTKYNVTSFNNVIDKSEQNIFNYVIKDIYQDAKLTFTFMVNGEQSLYFDYFNDYSNALKEGTLEDIKQISVKKAGASNPTTFATNWPKQMNNGTLYLGTYKDTFVTVTVTLKNNIYGRTFGIYSIDKNILKNAVNCAIGGDIDINFNGVSGKITAGEGQSLITCLPYDEGYKAKVNGKSAKVFSVNGLMAVELENGECEIKVTFLPKGLILGCIAMLLGGVLLALYLIYYKKVEGFNKFDKAFNICGLAIGIVAITFIYLMPVVVNLLL